MELLRRLRDFLTTDVEVIFDQDPAAPLKVVRQVVANGATTVDTDGEFRYVFHGLLGLFAPDWFLLHDPRGNVVSVYRQPFGRMRVFTTAAGDRPYEWTRQLHLRLRVGAAPVSVPDPRGGSIRFRRIRHRDFRLFQDGVAAR